MLPDQLNQQQIKFNGRLAIQQRVFPEYRETFFETLAERCEAGLSIFAGKPQKHEQIKPAHDFQNIKYVESRNLNFLSVSSKYYVCWQIGLTNWLDDWLPDSLILEANPRYFSSPKAIQWMRTRNLPVLGWGLGIPSFDGASSGWRRKFRVQFLYSLDAIISYSQKGANEYKNIGIPAERIFVAPNAIVRSPFSLTERSTNGFVEHPKVLFVGRLQYRKRLDLLISACARLPENLQPSLWIIGDGPVMKEVKDLASRIYPKTQFLGSLFGDELEIFFRNADLFVLPGTGGLAVQQAMAYGLPVIMAEGDGTQSDLIAPDNGWQIKTGNEESLFETLFEALSDPLRLRQMGLASYHRVKNTVNVDRMADVFIEALNYARNKPRLNRQKNE